VLNLHFYSIRQPITYGRVKIFIAGSIVLSLLVLITYAVNAYTPEWEPPVRLTAEDSMVQYSAIATDVEGTVHVFWGYYPEASESSNVLFYRYREEGAWSEEIDLFAGLDWETFSLPFAYYDMYGRLHVIWNGLQGLYYSSAQASEAFSVRAWDEPMLVVRADALGQTGVVVGSDGRIHIVYSQRRPGTNIMYTYSDDSGFTWVEPLPLSDIKTVDIQTPDAASITMDSEGVLHVVWSENYPPRYIGRQILYAQSLDNGITWSYPSPLSELADESVWNAFPYIVADTHDLLHVVWAGCGDPVARCYRTSTDQGISWSGLIMQPFKNLVGSSGRDAMTSDPYGNVYWAGSLRYPQAFYFSLLLDSYMWRDPPQTLILQDGDTGLGSAHFPQLTISEGNHLHLLLIEYDGGPLWYIEGWTGYPRVEDSIIAVPPLNPVPINESPSITITTPGITMPVAATPFEPPPFSQHQGESLEPENLASPLIWAIVPVMIVLVIGITIVNQRGKR